MPPAPVPVKRWYGYQLMLADAAWIGLAVASGPRGSLFAFGYLAAPPTIHGLHRNGTMAAVSPLLRVLIPVLGAGIGVAAESCPAHDPNDENWEFCGLRGTLAGLGIGMLVAMVADYSLAWEKVAPAPAPLPPRSYSRVSLSSAGVAPIANGAAVVLGGRF